MSKQLAKPNKSAADQLRTQQLQIAATTTTTMFHQGPLPDAETLARYNFICPGAADRIIQMAERQSDHRQELEKIAVKNGAKNSTLGIAAGWSIGVLGLLCGAWLLSVGKSTEGFGAIILDIGSLVGVFIYGKRSSRKEREQKRA